MINTANYGFMKPEGTDFYNIADFNANMDSIDEELNKANTAIKENETTIESNKKATQSDISLIKSTLGYTKKNLLPNHAVSHTVNDLTVTVNADKSVTVNGKPSVNTKIAINSGLVLKAGTYILSGCPKTPPVMYRPSIEIELTKAGTTISDVGTYNSDIKGTLFTLEEDDVANCYIEVIAGQSTSKTFYPMIRRAEIIDDTYEPYILDVSEATALINTTLGYSCKNLIYFDVPESSVYQGITVTRNADRSLTLNGTVTGSSFIVGVLNYKLKKGRYTLSGVDSLSYSEHSYLYVKVAGTSNWLCCENSGTKEVSFELTSDIEVDILFTAEVGETLNGTIYPMLRPAEITDGTYEPYVADINTRLNEELICSGVVSSALTADFSQYKKITCYVNYNSYIYSACIHTNLLDSSHIARLITGCENASAQFNITLNSIQVAMLKVGGTDIDIPSSNAPIYVFGHR